MDMSEKVIKDIIHDAAADLVADAARRIFNKGVEVNTYTIIECLVDDLTFSEIKDDKKKSLILSLAIKEVQSHIGNK
ncbi:hypothetical protein Z042_23260 [Chania multitudinisentens RB-25]|uniref:Uncharacterized protein n=1 Tax=Chania multitudinisentens RB-25 TaxID=1441930 RepID=W0LKZ9_9GAMM|nr:hypothetical protein [Chania multitudinisentens]AHG23002.1 hypothetical protein Z042_23260 [Chania multitudinisentens RB-25]